MTSANNKFICMKRRIEKLEEKLKNESKVVQYKPRLSDIKMPASSWNAFYRLNDAFQYAMTCWERVYVFSVEPHEKDCKTNRMFIVASAEEFWHYYLQLKPNERHFYEVISENTACHMYFDLEYKKQINPDKNGYKMVHVLLSLLFELLKNMHNVKCTHENVLILDSSTAEKFSQHLILHIPNAVFVNNFAVGYFVSHLCQLITTSKNPKYKILSVKNDLICDETLFIDRSVYSKNRNFRLFLSSKKHKNSVLQRSTTCLFDVDCKVDTFETCCKYHQVNISRPKHRKLKDSSKHIFFASLITNVHYSPKIKRIGTNVSVSKEQKFTNINTTEIDKKNYDKPCASVCDSHFLKQLKEFVISQIPFNDNNTAVIRQYTYFASSHSIIFDIKGNRFCRNINRQHKSNNVFYLVNLIDEACYQMCYDDECRKSQFKQLVSKLPKIILNVSDTLDDDELLFYANTLSLP